jgi:hypothetical protein
VAETVLRRTEGAYQTTLALLFACLGVVLLGLVDVRRGFLLPAYTWASPWLHLNPHHLWWLPLGLAGVMLAFRQLHRSETRRAVDPRRLETLAKLTVLVLFAFLLVDTLLLYRGVGAARILAGGALDTGTLGLTPGELPGHAEVFPLAATPLLFRPAAIAANYLALVWHATFLALMWAGLGVVALPLYFGGLISPRGASRFRAFLGGVVYAVPQPFCSCCAAPIAASIYRTGASLVSSVAFLLASPTLNVTALILAATLLPPRFAVLRILGGGLLVVGAASLAGAAAGRPLPTPAHRPRRALVDLVARLFNRYCALFQFEAVDRTAPTPAGLILAWVVNAWRMTTVVVPTLVVGSVVAGAIVTFVPAAFTNDLSGVLLASALGTILMISTWTEIPVVAILAAQGLTGPAAALLMTLPAVSLPCLVIFGGALGSARVSTLVGAATFASGVVAGLLFL